MAARTSTHYDVLGIPRDADAGAVRSAWKLHVQAWHPDRFGDALREQAEEQTTRINEAYAVLRDSSRRAAYDCRLAADEAAARPEPVRRSTRIPQPAHRAPAAPVGSPMATAPAPTTVGGQAAAIGADAMRIVRRHPRVFAAAATIWLLVFGGSLVLHVASGPSLPSASARPAAKVSAIAADQEQVEDLAELAERAREEAERADVELQALMAEDARLAAAEAAAAEREARLAAQAARRAPKAAGAKAAAGGRRIVRVMPKAT